MIYSEKSKGPKYYIILLVWTVHRERDMITGANERSTYETFKISCGFSVTLRCDFSPSSSLYVTLPCNSVEVEMEPFSRTPFEQWNASRVTLPESTMEVLKEKNFNGISYLFTLHLVCLHDFYDSKIKRGEQDKLSQKEPRIISGVGQLK